MSLIAGVDGCRNAWICITLDTRTGALRSERFTSTADLLLQRPRPAVMGIDIPIGLTDSGPRRCDELARRMLGRRASCVFPAPVRAALAGADRAAADALHRAADGRGVGAQAFNIYRKIAEIDAVLTACRPLQSQLIEVHPEVSFLVWNGHMPLESKKSKIGKEQRRRLIRAEFGSEAFKVERIKYLTAEVADDDIADAFAALWSAKRRFAGESKSLPDPPLLDRMGLSMAIHV
jgi:predicted RNase H-like nuclease